MPATSFSLKAETPPVCLKVAIDLRSRSASPGVKPAHSIATSSLAPEIGARRAEYLLQLGLWIADRLKALAPPQIRVNHIPLDRARADDRHLNDQVVIGARLQARQHAHLCAAFDLKRAKR